MRPGKTYDINRLRDYSTLFSRSEVSRWHKSDWSSIRCKISRYDPSIVGQGWSYAEYIKHIYDIIARSYSNEYVYKNELISNWLMRKIGLSDSIVYSELRIGKAVADIAMFNGVSKVFEVKTLLDKDARLGNQLLQYERLFNEIYLVVPEEKSHLYLKRNYSAGIICYNHKDVNFFLVRSAAHKLDIGVESLMQVLHTHEYVTLVDNYFGYRPDFNDFNKFEICKDFISRIPADDLNKNFVEIMKTRKIHNAFSEKEYQFNQLVLAMNFSESQRLKLLTNLSTIIS